MSETFRATNRIADAAWELIAERLEKEAAPTGRKRRRQVKGRKQVTWPAQVEQPAADPRPSANKSDPLPGVV
jgi:hypothetical protein